MLLVSGLLALIHRPYLETHIMGQSLIFSLNDWSVVTNLGSSHVIKLSFFHINCLKPETLANRRKIERKGAQLLIMTSAKVLLNFERLHKIWCLSLRITPFLSHVT